ncbi:MAG: DNA helicase RecQ [Desulfobacteraceae bacterium]|nr:DNA helicase RecQ [Desulfobacteraceae bacterium]
MIDQARTILEKTFGYPSFKPFQEEVIKGVLNRQDTLVILPTGGGKSLCYIIPAMIFDGLTIVVSPLISLMEDQIGQLTQTGIPAVCLNSTLTSEVYEQNIRLLVENKIKLLYLAPETLMMQRTLELLGNLSIDLLAVDEAHCVSEWGHDFRPEYRKVQEFRKKIPNACVMALTATATPQVRKDILTLFKIPQKNFFMGSFNRDNLFLDVQIKNNPQAQLINFIKKFADKSGIIYCTTRKSVDNLCGVLTAKGIKAKPYHAGLDDITRKQNQLEFIRDDIQIMVATIAFGMGIDKPDVRFIVQYDLPKNIETYYQQIGRAGRDGLQSDCLLLYAQTDTQTITRFIMQKETNLQEIEHKKLSDMLGFARNLQCLRTPLLEYFGETFPRNCQLCKNCKPNQEELADITLEAQKFLSCIKRTEEIFGAGHIIDVLRGSKAKKVLNFAHDKLSTYGIGKDIGTREWKYICEQLLAHDLMVATAPHGSLKLTPKAWAVFKGEKKVIAPKFHKEPMAANNDLATESCDNKLFEQLRQKRKLMADQMGLPPYAIFTDKTLIELARVFPSSEESLQQIHGIGTYKQETFGQTFLDEIQTYCTENKIDEMDRFLVPPKKKKTKTSTGKPPRYKYFGDLFNTGVSAKELADTNKIQLPTVLSHLATFIREGFELKKTREFILLSKTDDATWEQVKQAFDEHGTLALKPIFTQMGQEISYDRLHLLRLNYLIQNQKT